MGFLFSGTWCGPSHTLTVHAQCAEGFGLIPKGLICEVTLVKDARYLEQENGGWIVLMPKVPESLNSAAILDPPSCPLLLQSANSLAAGMLIKCKVSSVGSASRFDACAMT